MTKENVLFSAVGLLLGFIVGFFFANSINQRAAAPSRGNVANSSAAQSNSSLPPGHPDIAASEAQTNAAPEADAAARKAREAPDDFDSQMRAAQLSYQANRFEDSGEFLLRANQLRPDNYEVVVALGNFNYDIGRYETAEKWYTAALLKKPDDINVRTDLGLTFFLRESPDIERAITEYRRSLERDPEHEPTLQNMIVALTRKGDLNEAQKFLDRLEKINPSHQKISMLREQLEKARASSANSTGDKGKQ
jgi:tetratricopeptide (TPR) repeat protein